MDDSRPSPLPRADEIPIRARATISYRLMRIACKVSMHSLFSVKVTGRENLPPGACVAILNHTQWLDPLVVIGELPASPQPHTLADLAPVAGMTMATIGGLGKLPLAERVDLTRVVSWILRRTGGVIPVDRGNTRSSIEAANRALAAGGRVLLCPEAEYEFKDLEPDLMLPTEKQFAPGEGLYPFYRGFAHFAVQNGAPVVPMALRYVRHLYFRKTIELVIGAPLRVRAIDRHTNPEQYRRAVDALTRLGEQRVLGLMQPDYPRRGLHLFARQLTMDELRHALVSDGGRAHAAHTQNRLAMLEERGAANEVA